MSADLRAWFVIVVLCSTQSRHFQFIVLVGNMPHVSMQCFWFWFFTRFGRNCGESLSKWQ